MKRKRLWLNVALFAAVLAGAYFINVEAQTYLGKKALRDTGLDMLTLPEALAKAGVENKLVLADMSAIWCAACRRLDREIFANDTVKQSLAEGFVFARIEYESKEGEAFMKKYDVKGFPTLLVLDAAGGFVKRLPITFDPDSFVENLRRAGGGDG